MIRMLKLCLSLFLFSLLSPCNCCPELCACDDKAEYVTCTGDGLAVYPVPLPPTAAHLELRDFFTPEIHLPDLPQLRELRIKGCGVHAVANGTFAGSESLLVLDLSGNVLKQIPGLGQQIQELDFSRNKIVALGANPLPQALKKLDLSNNALRSLEEELFKHLTQLEVLSLSGNQLERVASRSLLGLRELRRLDLSSNHIASVEAGAFQELSSLQHLLLAGNPLGSSLKRLDLFSGRPQSVDLSDSGLIHIPQSLSRLVSELRLSINALVKVSAGDLDSYPYLSDLELNECSLQEIEADALGRLERLESLWLSRNNLVRVPSPLPSSLRSLYVDGNGITELLGYTFAGLGQLLHLTLRRNRIKKLLPCAFCDLRNLRVLDLRSNRLETLPPGIFAALEDLQTLDLSLNDLRSLDGRCFDNLARLATLQLSRISSVVHVDNSTFDSLVSLRTLEMYDSPSLVRNILDSTRLMHGLRNLQEFNMMHNRLEDLRTDFPSFFPNLKILKISGNPWHCDHHIQWLSTWIKQSNVQFYSSYTITCSSPLDMQFKPLMMLKDSDFKVETETATHSEDRELYKNFTESGESILSPENISNGTMKSEKFVPSNADSATNPSEGTTELSAAPWTQANDKLVISFGLNPTRFTTESNHLSSGSSPSVTQSVQNETDHSVLPISSTSITTNLPPQTHSLKITTTYSLPTAPPKPSVTRARKGHLYLQALVTTAKLSSKIATKKSSDHVTSSEKPNLQRYRPGQNTVELHSSNSLVSSATLMSHSSDRVSRSALKASSTQDSSKNLSGTSKWIFASAGAIFCVSVALGYLTIRLMKERRLLYHPQQDELSLNEGRTGY